MAGRAIPKTAMEPGNPVDEKRERKRNLNVSGRLLAKDAALSPFNERCPSIDQKR
jgi:hypothetical protein